MYSKLNQFPKNRSNALKFAILDIPSACIHTSDSEDFVRSFFGLFSRSNYLLFPPSEGSTWSRVQPSGQEYADFFFLLSFFLLTTDLLTEYITYWVYACTPFAKEEKQPARFLDTSNKHYLKPIHRPQKVKLNCLETSFRLNGDVTA